MAKSNITITNPFSGITIVNGQKYWYPTVPNCCHISLTKVQHFIFDNSNPGHIDFVMHEPVYASEANAKVHANAIRSIFGFPPIP